MLGPGVGPGIGPGIGSGIGREIGSGIGSSIGSSIGPSIGSSIGSGIGPGTGREIGSGILPVIGPGIGPGIGPVLGMDYGERRIGLALSDPSGTLATPLTTLIYRAGKRLPLAKVERIARERGVSRLVIGLPLSLAGEETERCGAVRRMGAELSRRLEVPVEYVDERMSSVRAQRMIRSSGLPRGERERKERVDAAAAALILQGWLDREKSR